MERIRYEVQRGDTPRRIAEKFTGDRSRWVEMIPTNPRIPVRRGTGSVGKSFEPTAFQPGMLLNLPADWASHGRLNPQDPGIVGGGTTARATGMVGESCSPTPVDPHPTAYYQIQQDEWEAAVAVKFGQIKGGFGDWHPLIGANAGWWVKGFYPTEVGCKMNGWKAGQLIRVPKAWVDVPGPQFPKDALPYLKNIDGTAWVPSGGDTPRRIAEKFTGDRSRWVEMIPTNPRIPVRRGTGSVGKSFEPTAFQPGMLINLPADWASYGRLSPQDPGIVGAGTTARATGMVGGSCEDTLPVVTAHPTAYYRIQPNEWPGDVAVKFEKVVNGFGDWATLIGANRGDPSGFIPNGVTCIMSRWKAGAIIKVPQAWIDVEDMYFPKKALPYLVKSDGSAWTPVKGSDPTGCPAGTFRNPNTGTCATAPTCASDEIFDSVAWACKKGSGDKVGATDESFFKKNLGWLAAAGVVLGIGGALAINQFTKARKAQGTRPGEKGRPALPAHKDEDFVTVNGR